MSPQRFCNPSYIKIMSSLKDSQHLRIPFGDIELATKNFSTPIGQGGYGRVYKGELSLSSKLTTVAVKRLDSNISGQGFKEFLTEIQLLSSYKHQNLISLLGFCEDGDEKILIYEHAELGSLDKYLGIAETMCTLTWKQRVQICLGAARGVDYLHNHVSEQHRVIHRDIKSANILLDDNWKAMIADLGLSKIGPANEKDTFLITNACGTHGYCDPVYVNTGILTKESDVFSFGVVLFEVLCGRLCVMNVDNEHRFLAPLARSRYENERLHEIIDPTLRKQMNSNSLNTFSAIAYQCLQMKREQRPPIDLVVKKLVEALEFQEIDELKQNSVDYEKINQMSDSPVAYDTKEELYSHLSKGILLGGGKVWFSLDSNGGHHELISATRFTYPDPSDTNWITTSESRFSKVAKFLPPSRLDIKVEIRTEFLSRGVTYAAYLVFKFLDEKQLSSKLQPYVKLSYKLKETSESMFSYLTELRDNGWMIIELFQTIYLDENTVFEVLLEGFSRNYYSSKASVLIEGIEFQPINKLGDEDIEKSNHEHKGGNLLTGKTNTENQLPDDYEEMTKMLKEKVRNITEEDLNTFLYKGMLIDDDSSSVWFWVCKSNGKKCYMLGAHQILSSVLNQYMSGRAGGPGGDGNIPVNYRIKYHNESRFRHVAKFQSLTQGNNYCNMRCSFIRDFLSTKTAYACYLVYKLPRICPWFEYPIHVEIDEHITTIVYLIRPQSPVIRAKNEKLFHNPINRPTVKGLAKKRKDGWWEVSLFDFFYVVKDGADVFLYTTCTTTKCYGTSITIKMRSVGGDMSDFTIYGLEFRPI